RFAVMRARARATPDSRQGKNNLARAARSDGHADSAERTLDPIVFALHRRIRRAHEFHHEAEDDKSRCQARNCGKQQAEYCAQVRMPREQIISAIEPGQESRCRRSVELGKVRSASVTAMTGTGS